ncbi:PQQ-binding-like beta-propeller repeat protein [candidate division KSB1 bacterium]|nr:PQQ-binding-like beta-propeller repeat protein [candidate division KSB1 bacterium]
MTKHLLALLPISILFIIACETSTQHPSLENGDWLQYRADAARTGYTPHQLPAELTLRWQLQQPPPAPAWKGVHTRMTFDHAYQLVIAGQTLYFGSSTDCRVVALNAETGYERWSFFTEAPLRFAPVAWHDRIFAGSDDGCLYCLSASSGRVIWKKRGGPDDRMLLGNDRMISASPLRGGVAIKDDVLYFGAGIWPSEGIFIYALDPKTGDILWINDNSGGLEWDQPHPHARAKSGISCQGYLLVAGEHLIVPTGRAVPAALKLADGALDYFHLQAYREFGGSRIFATDSCIFVTSGNSRNEQEVIGQRQAIFSNKTGMRLTQNDINSPAMAISPDFIFHVDATDQHLKALPRQTFLVKKIITNRKGEAEQRLFLAEPAWTVDTRQPGAVAMIAAGEKIIIGTINHKVLIVDTTSKSITWTADVDGIPHGLAAAHGRLYVSTDQGSIFCFDSSGTIFPQIRQPKLTNSPYAPDPEFTMAAGAIISAGGVSDGYCLDLGCGDGRLAYQLAKNTNLMIYAIDSNPQNVIQARKRLFKAGLYGSRVTVHLGDLDATPYPDYFADLVVSRRSMSEGAGVIDREEITRLLRPGGGVACIGTPEQLHRSVHPQLTGAGEWTHLYSDPANTITSTDTIVKGPLGMLWFRDDQLDTPSRHGRGVGPLYKDGRLFVQGNHCIRAINAYNGRTLWEYHIDDLMKPYDQEHLAGAAITHGNWCIEGERLYVRKGPSIANLTGRTCLVLDAVTGNEIAEFRVPAAPDGQTEAYWGYIAVENGTLFGTIIDQHHIKKWAYRESDMSKLFSEAIALFAMDASTGATKWVIPAKHSIRHNTIAIGNGRLYYIDRPAAKLDELRNPHAAPDSGNAFPSGSLLALDAATGNVLFKNSENIDGTLLALSKKYNILVMTHQYTRFRAPSETRELMSGFHAITGKKLWQIDLRETMDAQYYFSSRPVLNDTIIYLEPNAYHLLTGKQLNFKLERTYACGIISSSKNMMLYRSSTMGYFDLMHPQVGTQNFGGIRPGCWINALPVGGIVLMPDDTDRCNCSYLIKATIALRPLHGE